MVVMVMSFVTVLVMVMVPVVMMTVPATRITVVPLAFAMVMFNLFVKMMFAIFHNTTFFPVDTPHGYRGYFRGQKWEFLSATELQLRYDPLSS
jgi:hypothetical protein